MSLRQIQLGLRRRPVLCCMLLLLAACTPPPALRDEDERHRPKLTRAMDAHLFDKSGGRSTIQDIRLSGAGKLLDENWRFIELRLKTQPDPVAVAFEELAELRVLTLEKKQLFVFLKTKSGRELIGSLPRRALILGETPFGEARVRLRELSSVTFLTPATRTKP